MIKTNWQDGEVFDGVYDYHRIRDNIIEVYNLVLKVYPHFDIIDIEDKDYDDFCFDYYFNDIERNIQTLSDQTGIEIEPTKHFVGNQEAWNTEDVNRIERTVKRIYYVLDLKSRQKFRYSGTFYSGEDWGIDSI